MAFKASMALDMSIGEAALAVIAMHRRDHVGAVAPFTAAAMASLDDAGWPSLLVTRAQVTPASGSPGKADGASRLGAHKVVISTGAEQREAVAAAFDAGRVHHVPDRGMLAPRSVTPSF